MAKSYAKALDLPVQPITPGCLILKGVTGKQMRVVGFVDCDVEAGRKNFWQRFIVVEDADYNAKVPILGCDFFAVAKPFLDFNNCRCCILGFTDIKMGGLTRLDFGAASQFEFGVHLVKPIRLKPRSQTFLSARVVARLKHQTAEAAKGEYICPKAVLEDRTLLIEPCVQESLGTVSGAVTGATLAFLDEGDLVNILLLNPSNHVVRHKEGYQVGMVTPIVEDAEEALIGFFSDISGPSVGSVIANLQATEEKGRETPFGLIHTGGWPKQNLASQSDVYIAPCAPEDVDGDEQPQVNETDPVNRFATPVPPTSVEDDPRTWSAAKRRTKLNEILMIDNPSLSEQDKDELKQLILSYSDVFALSDTDLGCCNVMKHKILTGTTPPIGQRPYRVAVHQRPEFQRQMDNLEKSGVIKDSTSPWSSPVVIVPKKDGSMRVCIDFRRLNAVTERDVYPLPRIEELLDYIGAARYFSSIDLAQGFLQIEIEEEDQKKTAFTSSLGLKQYTRMPFGLTNAPATFQRLMEIVLSGLHWVQCLVYIDDILVFSPTFEQHLVDVQSVLERLRKYNLRAKPSKCKFGAKEVEFLGHVVSDQGLRPDPKKLRAVDEYPRPKDLRDVRSFVGLTNYYRRFIDSFATVAVPLYELMRAGQEFIWTERCEEAFKKLKAALMHAPTLAFPDFNKEFILTTDASKYGIGAILSQKMEDGSELPISFWSRRLRDPEVRWNSAIEWEALAIVWAVAQNRAYLQGRHFRIITDHAPLKWLMSHKDANARLMKWALKLQGYDFTIEHKAGATNVNADALSRSPVAEVEIEGVPISLNVDRVEAQWAKEVYHWSGSPVHQTHDECSLCAVLTRGVMGGMNWAEGKVTAENMTPYPGSPFNSPMLRSQQAHDSEARIIFSELHRHEREDATLPTRLRKYVVEDGILFVKDDRAINGKRVFVPALWRREVVLAYHHDRLGAHLGQEKVLKRIARRYYWPTMIQDVIEAISTCHVCQIFKRGSAPKKVPLTPIKVPGEPFERIACDCLTLTTTAGGNRYAIVFKDYLTKWPEVFAVPDTQAETVADCLIQVIARHGCPRELLTDRGSNFMSETFTTVCRRLGIKNLYTTSYNPKGDGMVERFNRTLIQVLRAYTSETQRDWDEYLPFVLAAYRASIHSTTNDSPFFLLYGRDMTTPIDLVLSPPSDRRYVDLDDYKEELFVRARDAWIRALAFVDRAQSAYKTAYDRTAVETKLKKGGLVLVKVHNVATGRMRKLGPLWKGPFRIMSLTPSIALLESVADPRAGRRWHNLCNLKPYRQSAIMPKPDARQVPLDPFMRTNQASELDTVHGGPTIVRTPPTGRPTIASAPNVTSFASSDSATTPPVIILNDDTSLPEIEGEGNDVPADADDSPGVGSAADGQPDSDEDDSALNQDPPPTQPADQAAGSGAAPPPEPSSRREKKAARQRAQLQNDATARRSPRLAAKKARRADGNDFRARYARWQHHSPSDED